VNTIYGYVDVKYCLILPEHDHSDTVTISLSYSATGLLENKYKQRVSQAEISALGLGKEKQPYAHASKFVCHVLQAALIKQKIICFILYTHNL
jgi:hypothetical protein